jgi:hypothetical protein
MQQFPDTVCRLVSVLAVDSEHVRHQVRQCDLPPVRRGTQQTLDTAQTTVYKWGGAVIYDLYVAHAPYRAGPRSRGAVIA